MIQCVVMVTSCSLSDRHYILELQLGMYSLLKTEFCFVRSFCSTNSYNFELPIYQAKCSLLKIFNRVPMTVIIRVH